MTSHIIFLHGASSSGKSTLARAIQSKVETPFWHISIDHLRDAGVLPLDRIKAGDFQWADMRGRFFAGFHASLAAYAEAGNDLIVEHILDEQAWLDDLVARLRPFDVFFVGVHCSLPELIRREKLRGDRVVGSAKRDFETLHVGRSYDVEVSGEDALDENVSKVLEAWRSGRRSSDFTR